MRIWLTNILLLALAIAFLVHFSLILLYSEITIGEPNLLILGPEIGGMAIIAIFATVNLVQARKG